MAATGRDAENSGRPVSPQLSGRRMLRLEIRPASVLAARKGYNVALH